MDKIDRLYERKKFLKIIFPELPENEFIRIFQKKGEDFNKVTYYNNIDSLNDYLENNRFNANTYFTLSTTDGEGGEVKNLLNRNVIAFDFDKKDFPEGLDGKDIMFKFKALNLWYHALIDSGHGFHVYICIEKTNDIEKIVAVTKAIGKKLGADTNAMLPTQILRVPYTFNIKEEKNKQVNIIKMFPKETIKHYKIDKLYSRFCSEYMSPIGEDKNIIYATNSTKFPPCIINILKGVTEGDRNFALRRLISYLKIFRYSKSESINIIKEWNNKNDPSFSNSELEYQFNYIWEKPYNYSGCMSDDINLMSQLSQYCDKEECTYNAKGDILFIEGETIQMEYKLCKNFENKRKDVFKLKGNHLLVIGILKNNIKGLNTGEIINELSYDGKCSLSNKTLGKALKELTENNYITKIPGNKRKGINDFYKWNRIRCEEFEKFNLSYFAILGAIKGQISPEDLKVYCYIRYRFKIGKNVVQSEIAEHLGVSQQSISKHINKLLKEKYLKLEYVDYRINPYGVNIYSTNV